MSLYRELRRRNVFRVAAAYSLVSWILIEAGSVLLPTFGAPEWFFKVYVIIVLAGFILAMIIAWVFEITPDGVKLERDVDRDSYESPRRGGLNVALIGLLVIALGISLTFNLTGMRDRHDEALGADRRDSVAVLPFASLSTDPENQFFTDGIHADLLTSLSESGALRVISGTSVAEYRDTTKNVREIGRELGVGTIVEGAVQRSGDQVRIMVQLVDTASDKPIWSDSFDRELTMQNVFQIQSQISSQIAGALRSALTPDKEVRLTRIPTTNVEAYAQYVQGRNNLYQRRFDTLQKAREQFEQAIALDPEYAQAYAGLAETIMVLLTNHKAMAPGEAYRLSEDAVAKALQYDPELADAYAVHGIVEFSRWKTTRSGDGNARAAASFERAIELNPNLANAYVWFASLRELEFDLPGAIELLSQALRIDPLGRIPYVNLPGMLAAQGENDQAVQVWLKAMTIFPDWPLPIQYMAEHLEKMGRLDEALAWRLHAQPLTDDPMSGGPIIGIYQEFGMVEPMREFLDKFPTDHPLYPLGKGFEHFLYGNYRESLDAFESLQDAEDMPTEFMYPLMAASAVFLKQYDTAYDYIVRGNPTLTSDANNVVNRFNLGAAIMLAYVQQKRGQSRDANRILQQAETTVAGIPRLGWAGHGIRDVQIYTLQGRKELALDRLRDAIDDGFVSLSGFAMWSLDIDPLTEALRDEPRYQRMLQEVANRIDIMRRNVEAAAKNNGWQLLRAKIEST